MDEKVKQPLQRRLEEIKSMLPKESECKLIEIIKDPEEFGSYRIELFQQWRSLLNLYKKLLEEERREFEEWKVKFYDYIKPLELEEDRHASKIDTPRGYVLLGVLAEGLVKIILFFDDHTWYLGIEQGRRTLGKKLKGRLIGLLKDNKKESNETKIKELEDSLELITSLRNNFIHFPFYYSDDYRFRWIFFQVFAYLLDKFSLWEYLESPEVEFIKEAALKKPEDVSLLDVDLYEQ